MSQEQPRKPPSTAEQLPIKYGDVFEDVAGKLAAKTISPEDAAMMQAAETTVLGETKRGGAAAAMQSAAQLNEKAGVVGHRDVTAAVAAKGVSVEEMDIQGTRIVTESIGGQVVGQYAEVNPAAGGVLRRPPVTIGDSLEAAARSSADRPVDHSDAAAIQAAEFRATGSDFMTTGGLGAAAQSAAAVNDDKIGDKDKIKMGDILTGATAMLPEDKAVTAEDAAGIMNAEMRNQPRVKIHPGGVAEAAAAAARINERGM
ncbi:late embryogenesis abundant protein D-34-like [Andrographis paniculata]|uniref:late embryogenesis abundant protein D-34-like n=1 Tax=Andrographis paniculata TaxID=175694 RepID=UPI0021E8A495|nr:late embryogenesis abundant protein D-34-like [Andrographis paniculata]